MSGGRRRARIKKVLKAWGRGIKRLGITQVSWHRAPSAPTGLPTGSGLSDGAEPGASSGYGAQGSLENRRFAGVPFKRLYTEDALGARRTWASGQTRADLSALSAEKAPPADIFKGNIESHIGFVQVPIGVAGPILVDGEHAQGAFYVPMATTEGALVASCTRGMRAV
ncbi:MAG: hypothetical protein FJZ00_06840, partial [Candidatus Sericytochromatia bacterium]|nr:hypothetical protein [Candidatus Tanganyikabacteria bacterium]